jgi:hypothetical protein
MNGFLSPTLLDEAHTRLAEDGFVHLPAFGGDWVSSLQTIIEQRLPGMWFQLSVDEDLYLQTISAWGWRNELVQSLLQMIQERLAALAVELGGVESKPIDATLFMKSPHAPGKTHAHQDVAYRWDRPEDTYTLTTWLALDDCDGTSGGLSFLPGSHKEEIQVRQDFLDVDFEDRSDSDDWRSKSVTPFVRAGDLLVFDARVWHAAYPFTGSGVRRAIAVRWINRELARTLSVPPPHAPTSRFGMDTSGRLLIEAAKRRFPETVSATTDSVSGVLGELLPAKELVKGKLPEPAWLALGQLDLALKAMDAHHGRPHSPNIWEPIRDLVLPEMAIKPEKGGTR